MNKISILYFSATGNTKKVVLNIAKALSEYLDDAIIKYEYDITLSSNRLENIEFSKDEVVIIGMPVYAGRLPNVLLKFLQTIKANETLAVPVVVYGNRDYDDALIELNDILENDGFNVILSAAFIGEHSFSDTIAKGRPDIKDVEKIYEFASEISKKIKSENYTLPAKIKGNKPYRNYYQPKNCEGEPVDFKRIKPSTLELCVDCKICVNTCPMGSIDYDDVSLIRGICIKCCSCVKKCPVQAKQFNCEDFIRHKLELELELTDRKEPEIFL